METPPVNLSGITDLVDAIQDANKFSLAQTQRQVNAALTLRNWLVGYYIVEYEQNGADRAEYRDQVLKSLSLKLKTTGIRGLGVTVLTLCRQFYLAYPQMDQSPMERFQVNDSQSNKIHQSLTDEFKTPCTPANTLLNKLSFTHFAELVQADSPIKRLFCETEAIKNNNSCLVAEF